jgi:hypothetical protein
MKFKLALIAVAATLLTGCASTNSEYKMYTDVQKSQVQARAMVEAARWNALAEVAKTGDATAKVAVAMAVATNNGGGGNNNNNQPVVPPKSWGDTALQWTSLLLPGFTQLYGINQNTRVAITQSNNSTALGMKQSDNQANVAVNTNAAFTNMNAAGLTAATGIANTGMTSITSVANTGSNNLTSLGIKLIDTMPLIQPNVTTTTTSTSTSTSATTNNCGSGTSGGTLTCP